MPIRAIDRSEIPAAHPVAVFHRFWQAVAGSAPWPSWTAFDAAQHPKILPWILLLKREDAAAGAPPNWRYAVCGGGCTELFGFSYQGRLFGEQLPPEDVAQRRAEFGRAVAGLGPQFSQTDLPIPEKEFVAVLRGVFPFAAGPAGVDRLVVILARRDTRLD